jgi:SAM-dependent methyltransferase
MKCPLCQGSRGSLISSTPYEEIFRALRATFGETVTPELEHKYSAPGTADEYRCAVCGLGAFWPGNHAGPDFYDALASSGKYYKAERWEYPLAAEFITGANDNVLDIGCGFGDFLKLAQKRSSRVFGIDTNPAAVAELHRRDIRVFQSLQELSDLMPRKFDLVCAFQLLEHLPDVNSVIRPVIDLLSDTGVLFVSVPNGSRYRSSPVRDPLDMPPHHVSHWAKEQFRHLGELHGLEVQGCYFERRKIISSAKIAIRRAQFEFQNRSGTTRSDRLRLRDIVSRASLGNTMAASLRKPRR